jgi:hypothetical protein
MTSVIEESAPLLWQVSTVTPTLQSPQPQLKTAEKGASGVLRKTSYLDRFAITLG